MTNKQRLIAEKIVGFMKAKETTAWIGDFNLENLGLSQDLTISDYQINESIALDYLISNEFIKAVETGFFNLTKSGWDFLSFDHLEQKARKDEELQKMKDDILIKELQKINLHIEDLVSRVSDYTDNKSKSVWSFRLSIITVIISLVALIISLVRE